MDIETIVWVVLGVGLAVLTWKAIQRNSREGGSQDSDYGSSDVAWDNDRSGDSDWGSSD